MWVRRRATRNSRRSRSPACRGFGVAHGRCRGFARLHCRLLGSAWTPSPLLSASMNWTLLRRTRPPWFILGDTPVTLFQENRVPHMGIGFATEGVEVHMPVSPTHAFVASAKDSPLAQRVVDFHGQVAADGMNVENGRTPSARCIATRPRLSRRPVRRPRGSCAATASRSHTSAVAPESGIATSRGGDAQEGKCAIASTTEAPDPGPGRSDGHWRCSCDGRPGCSVSQTHGTAECSVRPLISS